MPPRPTAERIIVERPASPEETRVILGMSAKRAVTLRKLADEALRDITEGGSSAGAARRAMHAKKTSAKG